MIFAWLLIIVLATQVSYPPAYPEIDPFLNSHRGCYIVIEGKCGIIAKLSEHKASDEWQFNVVRIDGTSSRTTKLIDSLRSVQAIGEIVDAPGIAYVSTIDDTVYIKYRIYPEGTDHVFYSVGVDDEASDWTRSIQRFVLCLSDSLIAYSAEYPSTVVGRITKQGEYEGLYQAAVAYQPLMASDGSQAFFRRQFVIDSGSVFVQTIIEAYDVASEREVQLLFVKGIVSCIRREPGSECLYFTRQYQGWSGNVWRKCGGSEIEQVTNFDIPYSVEYFHIVNGTLYCFVKDRSKSPNEPYKLHITKSAIN